MKAIQFDHGVDGVNALQLIKAGLLKVIEALERSGFGIVDKRVADFDLGVTDFPRKPFDIPLQCMVTIFKGLLPHSFQLTCYGDHFIAHIESNGAIGMPHRIALVVQFEIRMRRCHTTVIE